MKNRLHTLLWFCSITTATFCILVYALKGHWLPVFGSVVLVYLTKPIHRKFRALGLSSQASAFIISLAMFSIILFLTVFGVPRVLTELARLVKQLPSYTETTIHLLNQFLIPYDITIEAHNIPKMISSILAKQDISTLQTVPKFLISTISQFIDIILFLTGVLFIPIFFFFAIQHSDHFLMSLLSLVPPIIRDDVHDFFLILHETLSAWVVGQGSVIIILAFLYTVGLLSLNIPYAIILGTLTGILYIIPAVGPILTLILTITITIASFGVEVSLIAKIIGLYTVIQTIEAFAFSPYLIGNRLGINLSMSLFSILVGGGLLGGVGIVFAIPVASIIKKTIKLVQEKLSEDCIYD
jgi:predicted PurR-regulated permease PerM